MNVAKAAEVILCHSPEESDHFWIAPIEIGLLGRPCAHRRPAPTGPQGSTRRPGMASIEIGLLGRRRAHRRPAPMGPQGSARRSEAGMSPTGCARPCPSRAGRGLRRLKSAFSGALAPTVGLRRRARARPPAGSGDAPRGMRDEDECPPKAGRGLRRLKSAFSGDVAPAVGLRRRARARRPRRSRHFRPEARAPKLW